MSFSREIGSEFWDVPTGEISSGAFPDCAEWFISGRSALAAVIEDALYRHDVRTAALPSWCCESMVTPFITAGIEVSFYPVTLESGFLRQDVKPALGSDLLLVMGYFGMSGPPEVPESYTGIVVEDVTHSLLSSGRCPSADYQFGSLRKWCGVWTGGFAWRNDGAALAAGIAAHDGDYWCLRKSAMEEKAAYIETGEGKKGYLEVFAEAEEWLDAHMVVAHAHMRDVMLADRLDVEGMRAIRLSNGTTLLNGLRRFGKIVPVFSELCEGDCPLFMPILVNGRDSLRRYLIENNVYCPVHWPISDAHILDEGTRALYEHGLSLVCDQRYGLSDMTRIIDLVETWLRTS